MRAQLLNPADHFTLVLDNEIRDSGLAGNFCALALELDGMPDPARLELRCREFASRYPLAAARLIRRGRHYEWVVPRVTCMPFRVSRLQPSGDGNSMHEHLLDIVNSSVQVFSTPPFELHLIESGSACLLALRWFHPAADAKGAELVMHHLINDTTPMQMSEPPPVGRLQHQWSLWRRLMLARQAARNIREIDRKASVHAVESAGPAGQLRVELVRFDEAQTERILSNARKCSGMAGTTLYLIGCMMRAMEITGSSRTGDAYCVPYAVNLRRRKMLAPMFGNQVSFLFAHVPRELVHSRSQLFAHLGEQNKAAVRNGLDHAMLPLMQAGSWLPLRRYGKVIRLSPGGGERSSFWFSYTGEMEPAPDQVDHCPVRNMYQLCQVTAPPGVSLLVSAFRGKLTLSFNFTGSEYGRDWIDRLKQSMTSELLDMENLSP